MARRLLGMPTARCIGVKTIRIGGNATSQIEPNSVPAASVIWIAGRPPPPGTTRPAAGCGDRARFARFPLNASGRRTSVGGKRTVNNNNTALRVRRSIQDLQDEYTGGDKKPLEDLMRAWRGIKELPPEDPRSFFVLGGYHGEPFRGAGWGNSSYWGGYCHHGNVLFPTWHRVYLLKLEDALRSIPGCGDVTLPFWDETSP